MNHRATASASSPIGHPGRVNCRAGVTDDARGKRSGAVIQNSLRPPEGSGHADERPDARRSDPSEDCPPAAVRSPAVASGQSFESDILKLARAC